MNKIDKIINDSANDFLSIVWPEIKDIPDVGGGKIIPVETVTENNFANLLDRYAGIDQWQVVDGYKSIRGIASRVQWGKTAWNSFTIRFKMPSGSPTEWHKRNYAIINGWLYPELTIQAYITQKRIGHLIGIGIVKTKDLINYLLDGGKHIIKINPNDGVKFIAVFFKDCKEIMIKK